MEFKMDMFDNIELSDIKTKQEVINTIDFMVLKSIAERAERARRSCLKASRKYRTNDVAKTSGNILRLTIAIMEGEVGYEELTECQLNYLKDFAEGEGTIDIKGLQTLNKMLQRKQRHLMQKNQ